MAKATAVIFFVGGAAVIRSVMTPTVSMPFLIVGSVLLLIALIMFIKQLKNI